MRLNRTQKIMRNFLCMALLLLIWWVLTGMQPVTPKQALRWEAQRWGLREEPEILYRETARKWNQKNVVFTADGKLGLSRTSWGIWNSYAGIGQMEEPGEVTLLYGQKVDMYLGNRSRGLYVVADIPDAAEAELSVYMKGRVTKTASKLDTVWEETYTMTACPNENNVYPFYLAQKDPDDYTEQIMFDDFFYAMKDYEITDHTYVITLTFRDAAGNTIKTDTKTYENMGWNE